MRVRCLLIVFCWTLALSAASVVHRPGFYFAGGVDRMGVSSAEGGYGPTAAIGFDYRLTVGHFLFNTGLGATFSHVSYRPSNAEAVLPNQVDQNGYTFTYHYFFSHRSDTYQRVGLELPVLLGAEFGNFSFLLGAKAKYYLWGQSSASLSLRSQGEYPDFVDPMVSMPEHAFYDLTALPMQRAHVSFAPELSLSAELAYRVYSGQHTDVTLALFADYGVYSPVQKLPSQLSSAVLIPTKYNALDMLSGVSPLPLMPMSRDGQLHADQSWMAGLKLLIHFPVVSQYRIHRHYPCRCVRD